MFHQRIIDNKKKVNAGHNVTKDTLEFLLEACRSYLIMASSMYPCNGIISALAKQNMCPIPLTPQGSNQAARARCAPFLLLVGAPILSSIIIGVGNDHSFRGDQVYTRAMVLETSVLPSNQNKIQNNTHCTSGQSFWHCFSSGPHRLLPAVEGFHLILDHR